MVAASPSGITAHRANNFDALRFWAALAVVWSHSYSVSAGGAKEEFVRLFSGGQTNLGNIAVGVFFVISGYLITMSFDKSSSVWRFMKARALRILPAMAVVIALAALVLGPILTTVPVAEYFRSWELVKYLANVTFLAFNDGLPGVFADQPLPFVNASLWTLRFEAECYLLVLLLGVAGLLNRFVVTALFLLGLGYMAALGHHDMESWHLQNHRVRLATLFLSGAMMYLWRVKLDARIAALCAVVLLVTLGYGHFWLAINTAGAYLTIYVALAMRRLPNPARYGDMSYGIYIYAWPVQQLVVMALPDANWLTVFALAAPAAMLLGLASWHLIEKRTLALKDRTFAFERPLMRRIDRLRRQPPYLTRPAR